MKKIHILNGECLYDQICETNIKGQFIICRECLIEGDLSGETFNEFVNNRAEYISETYGSSTDEYFRKTVSEFEKIINLPDESEINLWFENDLFCQTNMWFIISLLADRKVMNNVYRVFPVLNDVNEKWTVFGNSDHNDLELANSEKFKFDENDINIGNELWNAYKKGDNLKLIKLSKIAKDSKCFNFLNEVCEANAERPFRPEKTIREIIKNQTSEFNELFSEFSRREGIYGYGDSQVKRMYDKVMAEMQL